MAPLSSVRIVWLSREIFPHEPELRRWLRSRLELSDVDDVVQETYAVLSGMGNVDHILNPRSYLFTVAKSVLLKTMRKDRVIDIDRFVEAENLQVPCDRPGPDVVASDRQELSRLARLIEGLPPKCQQVFVLRKLRGLSQREAADALGISENTIEKHMGKAMMLLTDAIGRGGNERLPTSLRDERFDKPLWRQIVDGQSSERH